MKLRLFIFAAVMVAGCFSISPTWAEDELAKSAMPAAAMPSEATGDAIGVSTPRAVRSSSDGNENDYRIGQNDLLDVKVFQSELFNRTVRVSSSGYISMPLIGQVKAGGLTALELERLIAAKLEEKYLQEPQVSVFISEYTSQRVTIEGNVKNPGVYVLKGRTTLRQALAMSAGTDGLADLSEIRVHRMVNGESKILVYNLEAIRNGKEEDPEVRGNDIVLVESSLGQTVLKGVWRFLLEIATFGIY
jgi:polysaccharide export outer membrane protein